MSLLFILDSCLLEHGEISIALRLEDPLSNDLAKEDSCVTPAPGLQGVKQTGMAPLQAQENQTQQAGLNYNSNPALETGRKLPPANRKGNGRGYKNPWKWKIADNGCPQAAQSSQEGKREKGAATWEPFGPEPPWLVGAGERPFFPIKTSKRGPRETVEEPGQSAAGRRNNSQQGDPQQREKPTAARVSCTLKGEKVSTFNEVVKWWRSLCHLGHLGLCTRWRFSPQSVLVRVFEAGVLSYTVEQSLMLTTE